MLPSTPHSLFFRRDPLPWFTLAICAYLWEEVEPLSLVRRLVCLLGFMVSRSGRIEQCDRKEKVEGSTKVQEVQGVRRAL